MPVREWIVVTALLFVPGTAWAEVGDKVQTLPWLWGTATALTAVAVLLEALRPRLGLIVVPVAALWAAAGYFEFGSADLGPAIRAELGEGHILRSYAAFAAGVLGPLTVGIVGRRLRREAPVAATGAPRPGIDPNSS